MSEQPLAENDERLAELEIKMSYQEDALAALNDVIYQQQIRIDSLEALLTRYRQYFDNATQASMGQAVVDEKPPHY